MSHAKQDTTFPQNLSCKSTRDAQDIRTEADHPPLAPPVGAAAQGPQARPARPVADRGHPRRPRPTGPNSAPRPRQTMQLVVANLGGRRRHLNPLMTLRLGISPRQGPATAPPGRGLTHADLRY